MSLPLRASWPSPASPACSSSPAAAERAGGIIDLGYVFYQLKASDGGLADIRVPVHFDPPAGTGWTWRASTQLWRDDHFITSLDTEPTAPSEFGGHAQAFFHYRHHTKGVYTVGMIRALLALLALLSGGKSSRPHSRCLGCCSSRDPQVGPTRSWSRQAL